MISAVPPRSQRPAIWVERRNPGHTCANRAIRPARPFLKPTKITVKAVRDRRTTGQRRVAVHVHARTTLTVIFHRFDPRLSEGRPGTRGSHIKANGRDVPGMADLRARRFSSRTAAGRAEQAPGRACAINGRNHHKWVSRGLLVHEASLPTLFSLLCLLAVSSLLLRLSHQEPGTRNAYTLALRSWLPATLARSPPHLCHCSAPLTTRDLVWLPHGLLIRGPHLAGGLRLRKAVFAQEALVFPARCSGCAIDPQPSHGPETQDTGPPSTATTRPSGSACRPCSGTSASRPSQQPHRQHFVDQRDASS